MKVISLLQINSYGGTLTFSYSYNTSFHPRPSPTDDADVILEGKGSRLIYKNPGAHPAPNRKHKAEVKLLEV